MSFEITGKLVHKAPTQQVSDKFKKREFVLELIDDVNGNQYTNYAKFQLVQNKCEVIDNFQEGEQLKVSFNIKGNKWERDGKTNFITNLDAWRIERVQQGAAVEAQSFSPQSSYQAPSGPTYNPANDSADDLPF